MHPKKSLGPHWLFDEASLQAMLTAGEVSSSDTVLEVGPGLGTLTKKLCNVASSVVAVELDDILAADLSNKVQADNLQVVHESILDFDTSNLPKGYKVIANIPYYLTSNLIRIMLENPNPPSVMVLLVQKEVAERVAAEPGSMGILSVAAQFYAETALKELVPAELFTPPPKVDSQILQLKLRVTPLFNNVDTEEFFKVVRAGFSEKRKKLRSSLSGALQLPKDQIDQVLDNAAISPNARAQELTLEKWYDLYNVLKKSV